MKSLPKNGDYILQWRGERIDDCNTLAFQNAVKAAKVEPLRWHDLRHTWASCAVQSGVSLHELMLLGGWLSFSMVPVLALRPSRRIIWRGQRLKFD